MGESVQQPVYEFEGFRLDAQRRLLFGVDGKDITLTPRLLDTLLYLVERPSKLLTKEELLDALWPNVVVEEHNLNKTISELRRVLGERRGEHRFIVTKPGVGYRFVADVSVKPRSPVEPRPEELEPTPSDVQRSADHSFESPAGSEQRISARPAYRRRAAFAAALVTVALATVLATTYDITPRTAAPSVEPDSRAVASVSEKSVAVLPFADLSPTGDQQWFADGLTQEISNSLAQLSELRVTGRTSSFRLRGDQSVRDIGQTLAVAHVMEGSVQRVDDKLRVTARLVRAHDGFHVWSNAYDGDVAQLFDFQSDVAEKVAAALDVVLDETRRARMFRGGTRNVEPFEAAQRAWAIYDAAHALFATPTTPRQTLWDANVQFERATALDDHYTEAALGRMDAFVHLLSQARSSGLVANSPYSQEQALELLLETLDRVIATTRDPTMRLVAEINREVYSPTWYRMTGLLMQLRRDWDTANFHFVNGVDSAMVLPTVLLAAGHHDLARRIDEEQLGADPLAGAAWNNKFFVELHARNFGAARQLLSDLRQKFGSRPVDLEWELYVARLEGNRERMIEILNRSRPVAAPLLLATKGDYETALRLAEQIEGNLNGIVTCRLSSDHRLLGDGHRRVVL